MISSTRPRRDYPLDFIETLRNWANSSRAEKDLETVFGQALHWPSAYRHLDAFRRGDFTLLPPVEVLEDAAMPGLWGGYSRDLRLVFLSEDCPEDLQTAVLLDEIGHFLDQELCTEETPGEEGAYFAALILGSPCVDFLKDEPLCSIYFDGKPHPVEAAPKVRGSAKTKATPAPKVRGKVVPVVPDTTTSQDGNVVYANKDSVRLVQTKANQRVIGSKGNDTFVVSSQNVRLEDPNGGTDTVETSVSFSLGNFSFIENLTAVSGTSAISLTGNAKANVITGNSGNNVLDGGVDSQKDTLIGGAGNDTYIIRDALDIISDASGTDVIFTTNQSLSLSSYTNIEHICFIGTDGADSMTGGAGAGTLLGGKGNDTYFVDNALDSVSETDSLTLTGGVDWVNTRINHALGSNVENLIKSGNANVRLTGNTLGNIIDGSAGGVNTLSGGAGNDTLIVNTARYGSIDGGTDTDILRLVGTRLNIRNPAFTGIEILDLSLLAGSASVTLNSAANGLETLVASSFNDTIDASAYTASILIDASAGSGSRLIGATGGGLVNTLIGGANGGNEFVLDAIGTDSLVGGFGGLDTLTLTNGGSLEDSAFTPISGIGILKLEGGANIVTLGDDALAAGIRTLVGGEGDDLGSTFDTSDYGTVGVVFQVTDQFYLNRSNLIGSAGVDTLKFSRDGVSVTDENVDNLTDIDVIQTANGTNRFLMHDAFYLAGIDSIIGGTGTNIIDMSHPDYDPLNRTTFDDAITFDMSAGSYSLLVNDSELRYAKVVGGSPGGSVSILDDIGIVTDIMFSNLYDAKINSVSYSGASIFLGENAMATGMSALNIADTDAYVWDFNAPLVVTGIGTNSAERVFTSFAALADLTFNGGSGSDTLALEFSDARVITSLKGDFDVLALDGGNNFVRLGNDAGLSVIVGGTGVDTLNFSANTTGINFVMNASLMGDTVDDALITGGSGSDMLAIEFGLTTENTLNDIQFTQTSLQLVTGDTLNGFTTDTSEIGGVIVGQNYYIFDEIFDATGISRIFAHNGDTLDAGGASGPLNFILGEDDFPDVEIIGTDGDDTLTLNIASAPSTVEILDADFALLDDVEILVLNSVHAREHANFEVVLGGYAETLTGLEFVIGGNGGDSLDASAMTAAVTLSGGLNVRLATDNATSLTILQDTLIGGIEADSLHGDNFYDSLVGNNGADTLNGTSSTALGANEIDTLTGGGGNDVFILGDASNAYYNTGARASDYALITDFTAGDKIRIKDLSALYSPTAPLTNDYGYLIDGTDIHGVGALGVGVNSYLYADTDKSGTITTGDNLIAAINSTGGVLTNVNATNFTIV